MAENSDEWRLPQRWGEVLLVAYWILVGCLYYNQPQLKFRWDRALDIIPDPRLISQDSVMILLRNLGVGAWLAFLGSSLGSLLLRWQNIKPKFRLDAILFSLALGWGVLGTILAILGLCRLLYATPLLIALAVVTLPAGYYAYRGGFLASGAPKAQWSWFDAALAGLLALFVAVNLIGTLVPEIFFDALEYHLALPASYWLAHGFMPTPENTYSGVPLLTQMLYGLVLPIGGDRLAHVIHFTFGLSAALLAFCAGRRFASPRAGLIAALLFYSCPLVGVMSWKAGADLSASFYQLAAIFALALAFAEQKTSDKWLLFAGLLTGFTMATRYQAWPVGIIVAGVLVWRLKAEPWRLATAIAAMAGGVVIWPIRNAMLYGNPMYPFFQEWFATWGNSIDWRAMLSDGGRDWRLTLSTWQGFLEFLLNPWYLSIREIDTQSMGPLFLLGVPLLGIFRYRSMPARILFGTTLAAWLAWCLTATVQRYFLPTALLAALFYAVTFESNLREGLKRVVYGPLVFVVVTNLFWTMGWLHVYEAQGVLRGAETAGDYLSRAHPSYSGPYYPCARFINENLPSAARILVFGDARGYYLERANTTSTVYAENPLGPYLRASSAPEDLRAILVSRGYTHILFNYIGVNEAGIGRWINVEKEKVRLFDKFAGLFTKTRFEYRKVDPSGGVSGWCAVAEIEKRFSSGATDK